MSEIKSDYDIQKIEIEELKKMILGYFRKPRFDVTLSELLKEFKWENNKLNILQFCLDELVKDKILRKSSCGDHYEYDLKEEHGGIN